MSLSKSCGDCSYREYFENKGGELPADFEYNICALAVGALSSELKKPSTASDVDCGLATLALSLVYKDEMLPIGRQDVVSMIKGEL